MTRHSLTFKIIISFVAISIFVLTITSISIYTKSSEELEKQNEEMLTQIINNVLHHTDLYLEKYERVTLSMLTSSLVKQFWGMNDPTSLTYYLDSKGIIEQVIRPIGINNPEIAMIYLLGYDGKIISDITYGTITKDNLIVNSIDDLKEQTKEDGRMTVLNNSFIDGTVSLTRKIADRQSSKDFKGIMGIEINTDELNTLWQGIHLGDDGYFLIVNDRGKIIYHPTSDQIGKQLDGKLFSLIGEHSNESFTATLDGAERILYNQRSEYSGWTLVASMSLTDIVKPIVNVRQTTVISAIVTCLIALVVAFVFGRSIASPIQMLVASMRETEKGNWTRVPLLGKKDERDRLILSYNIMVDRLSGLVEQVYKAEIENKNNLLHRKMAEFQALQLQINPHFIYNTLDTIVSYAIVQHSKEIREIVRALAYMLRYAVRTDLEEVTVANELKHLLHYMTIMNYRFEDEFPLEVTIPSELLLEKMVTLTLQPIVENTFKHAFPNGIEAHHTIKIDAKIENDLFLIIISDNGIGIDAKQLHELQNDLKRDEYLPATEDDEAVVDGIGLLNVHNRIRMVFGDEYGLTVQSGSNVGTTIVLVMPAASTAHKLSINVK